MSELTRREVLVTGGGRGIGRAIALRFAEAGARVFVNFFVNREAAEKTARDVELRGGAAHLLQADLKEPAEIRRLVAEVERRAGRLDVLVSNAASGVLRDGLELSPKQWDWVLATNARALLILAQNAARLMSSGGRIVALSSLGSRRVIPGYAAIGVSKAALEALTRYLAVEFAARGITVNTVSAGAVETEVWQMMPEGTAALAGIRARTPGSALVTPEAVAEVVFFLASPAAQAIQGQVLTVDGGYSLLA
jgi:enoyl-[acyl-carrier protein] reductase III